jgi:hypothetical protein
MAVFGNNCGKNMTGAIFSRLLWGFILALPIVILFAGHGLAADDIDIDDIGKNVVVSSERLSGLVSAFAYGLGLLFAVLGVLKLKDHVENPSQVPLRTAMIRLLVGGALFALPIIYEAMKISITGGTDTNFDPKYGSFIDIISSAMGTLGGAFSLGTPDVNGILAQFIDSIESLPGVVSAVAYALALVLGVAGLLKLKDHVENPDQTPLRESVIRFLIGGVLLGLPTAFQAMETAITSGEDIGDASNAAALARLLSFAFAYMPDNPVGRDFTSLGGAIALSVGHAGAFPAFLTALSYLIGMIFGVWGVLKIRDHVLNPSQTSVWEGFSRLFAGGAFFTLPVVVEAVRVSLSNPALDIGSFLPQVTGYSGNSGGSCVGLDGALACMMGDVQGPIHAAINFFTFAAGMLFIMVGISRLTKSAQDGAKGPGGVGTFMTFLVGGALISYNEFMRAFSTTLFSLPITRTNAALQYTEGMSVDELAHAHTVISAVIKFLIIVGLISFVRGIFIIRNVAEGNGQASIMAGVTHLVGGTLAVNLGPLINAVQETLGLTEYGILFS